MSEPIDLDKARAKRKGRLEESLLGLRLTDLGNAERFAQKWAGKVRYCHGRKKWLIWAGTRWQWDGNGRIDRLAKVVIRSIYAEAGKCSDREDRAALVSHARKSESAGSIANMLRLAQSEEGIPVDLDELDANPMLLNAENGTIDLTTGALREHSQSDLITKLCPCSYDPLSRSTVWERFLHDATGDDVSLREYIQRAAGYAIQGEASERALFFSYGPPGSAKSTLIDALGAMLGDYHVSSAPETWLVQTNSGGNRGDLVRLAGARLVTAVEFKDGVRFDEALIKGVTGGDAITAAAKYEADVTFTPTFALWFAANDSPAIRSGDDAMWARMRRIPFSRSIPKPQQDKRVKASLKNDKTCRAAVLAWSVQGCLLWQQQGIGECQAVEDSNREYQAEMDPVGDFFSDHLVFETESKIDQGELRKLYGAWAKEEGVLRPLDRKRLKKAVEDRGGKYVKVLGKRIVKGVRSKGEWEQDVER